MAPKKKKKKKTHKIFVLACKTLINKQNLLNK